MYLLVACDDLAEAVLQMLPHSVELLHRILRTILQRILMLKFLAVLVVELK